MPTRSKRACLKSGCPALVDNGYCVDHEQHERQHDKWRGSAAERGYDSEWRRFRVLTLQRDKYLCQHCLANNRVEPATEVDHIKPLAQGGDRLLLENVQSLCHPCHVKKTFEDRNGRNYCTF
jgi:5-methylcytosine-specific restriction protein A